MSPEQFQVKIRKQSRAAAGSEVVCDGIRYDLLEVSATARLSKDVARDLVTAILENF